ncbi:hypothetical protein [Cryobacterium sp. PH29-G1]|uniref:hypothetical protein n=1 Tax=Cryobacterium sp. PH29-G1 TaxID=3046211 RepID=UPI0024B99C67|nr:hypothetical protein [Cryobacterium sp. PH29-G1]MDJ0348942.1 hypothetical protein [Cryobacterium sp. PH29-G1]
MKSDDLDDSVIDYADARFEIRPHPKYRDLMRINELVNALGYTMPFSTKQYSLEDVQTKLRAEGAHAFLRFVRLQEDISPKASYRTAQQFVAERLARLGPANDLIIIDPYLFPPTPSLGEEEYAEFLADLIAPLLNADATVRCVVNKKANTRIVATTTEHLHSLKPGVSLVVHKSEDFHDRFWIAEESRGVVVGASLNGLGSKLFFIDELRSGDVAAIMQELAKIVF